MTPEHDRVRVRPTASQTHSSMTASSASSASTYRRTGTGRTGRHGAVDRVRVHHHKGDPPTMRSDPELWRHLVALEPGLADLEHDALIRRHRSLDVWYRDFKPAMSCLVGWGRTRPGPELLFTHQAYDAAYAHLYATLTSRRRVERRAAA